MLKVKFSVFNSKNQFFGGFLPFFSHSSLLISTAIILFQTLKTNTFLKSFGGAQYFINFIDNYSRKMWTYTLKLKNQV